MAVTSHGPISARVRSAEDWPTGALGRLRSWEQGDIVACPPLFYYADPRRPIWEPTAAYAEDSDGPEVVIGDDASTPPFGMITTQTCDIAEEDAASPQRPWVQVAPVYPVKWKRKRLADGRGPQYWLLVPELPGDHPHVADLRIEIPVEKGWLAEQERHLGFVDEIAKRAVGERLAFLRGRPVLSAQLNAIRTAVRELLADDEHQEESQLAAIQEVGLAMDSYLRPTTVQLVCLSSQTLDQSAVNLLSEWRAAQADAMEAAGIALLPISVERIDSVLLARYREMAIIWRA